MKKQVVIIHGGDTFNTYTEYIASLKSFIIDFSKMLRRGWKENLEQELGSEFRVVLPKMPNQANAKYSEWKIWFEKIIPFLDEEVVFVGHSLGGIFLAKYFSENTYPKKIRATFLIAAPFDTSGTDYTLADFSLPQSLAGLEKQGGKIFIYQSKDDNVVPFSNLEKYKHALPSAKEWVFTDRGHFNQTHLPELVEDIQNL